MRRVRRTVLAALAAGIVATALVLRFGPPLLFSVALAAPRTEAWLAWLGPAPVREDVSIAAGRGRLSADLYRPARPRDAILLVHGLSRAGRRHPELVRLARLLARQGSLVLVPQFEGLATFHLSGLEVEDIRSGIRFLTGIAGGPVALAGFSFGAGPALLAAADLPGLRVVGSFGGYAELSNVIRYITTGAHAFGGQRYVRRQEEYNRWKLLALLVGFVEHERDRALLGAIAEAKLANPSVATEALQRGLGAEGRHIMALVLNRREHAVAPLLAGLPARARAALDRLSPLAVVPRLRGRLLIAHGADDDSIPFTESLRLAEAAPGRARVAILRTFHHTGPEPFWPSLGQRAVDGFSLFRLVDKLLDR
jgi:pimeloyl-ACP methyl ester carboxylesterase